MSVVFSVNCPDCGERIKRSACGGGPDRPRFSKCPACGWSGRSAAENMRTPSKPATCQACAGTGMVEMQECLDCAGWGLVGRPLVPEDTEDEADD